MLDADTKRRIDTARDILVGKVPDPKSQVEQITIALIYKFMDDIDADAEELGGRRKFFTGEFEKYGWAKLMRSGLGGHEMQYLYGEAIARMPENPGLPQLFRDIFNNAYLPYRDPETLRLFLKVIDEFTYDHPERLGDAYEYLLSVLGAQGDAGQFRTPRHIIDFMVEIIDPQKDESVLDPACGTAGFLISSYKRIQAASTDENPLSPDERESLDRNFSGYDISPDMVRLARANMYLHGFPQPNIYEYDSLTSEDRWNEYADVILANPPFMSPKGGIRPHNQFSIKARRSEVLFVDYIAEHLTSKGRAGVIVPEGIIFQSQNAYKQLRKMLVEDYLVAVISLPAGIFKPYSGVKTSILVMDKSLARKTDSIAFFKVENDGFDLGDQRREISENDLPQVQAEIVNYLRLLRTGEAELATSSRIAEDRADYTANGSETRLRLTVEKEKIAEDGDYNLSGERYRETSVHLRQEWPIMKLGDVCHIVNGSTPLRQNIDYWEDGTVPWFTIDDVRRNGRIVSETIQFTTSKALEETSLRLLPRHTVLLCCTASVGEYAFTEIEVTTNQQFNGLIVKDEFSQRLLPKYLFWLSAHFKDELLRLSGKTSFNYVAIRTLKTVQIPVPPMEIQREIVAEIEAYQKVIDGAQTIIDNWRPHIAIDSDWPVVQLGSVAEVIPGQSPPGKSYNDTGTGTPFYQGRTEFGEVFIGEPRKWTTDPRRFAENGDILMSVRAPVGPVNLATERICIGRGLAAIRTTSNYRLLQNYAFYTLRGLESKITGSDGAVFASINKGEIEKIEIPLPPLDIQQSIVAEVEAERAIVAANHELIQRMENKIQSAIARVWQQDPSRGGAAGRQVPSPSGRGLG